MENRTTGTSFMLLGLTDRPELQTPIFAMFLLIYAVTLVGNVGIVLIIIMNSKLHTPMYFFLANLSFVDLGYSTCAVPKMLVNFATGSQSIYLISCAMQLYFFAAFLISEFYILMLMAFDRYMAICHPLHYTHRMSHRFCILLVVLTYVYGFTDAMTQAVLTFRLSYCGSHEIHGFFCADPPLLTLSCSDIRIKQMVLLMSCCFNLSITILAIFVSYVFIISAILRIRSADARRKTFSTCSSHLMSVIIFYGTLFFMYVRPSTLQSVDEHKVVTVFYSAVIPMLNPLIYGLRNREVKEALKKGIHV